VSARPSTARWLETSTDLFPLWVLAGGALALAHPPWFTWFRGQAIVWGLAVVMLGMGITLGVEDFRRGLAMPRPIAAGFVAQFSLMPLLGWAIARLLALDAPLAAGLILVACCPGGTASNVVCYLARANVALSILMTTASTLGAVVMTPLLTAALAGAYVPVDALGLLRSTAQVVLLPVLAGLALHHAFPRAVDAVTPAAPLVSVAVVTLIVASIIGQSAAEVRTSGPVLLAAVLGLHVGGFALGWAFARLLGYDAAVSRTVSVEVGMQNSGLGVVLARQHFADPITALPCALSAVFHSVIGSLLAGLWRLRPAAPRADVGRARGAALAASSPRARPRRPPRFRS
jgi:BASS family bile acid:Na+ symporter